MRQFKDNFKSILDQAKDMKVVAENDLAKRISDLDKMGNDEDKLKVKALVSEFRKAEANRDSKGIQSLINDMTKLASSIR